MKKKYREGIMNFLNLGAYKETKIPIPFFGRSWRWLRSIIYIKFLYWFFIYLGLYVYIEFIYNSLYTPLYIPLYIPYKLPINRLSGRLC